jgi:hypothetical protein
MKVIKKIELRAMPYDRWDTTSHQHVHATGFEVELEDGTRLTEYEDSNFEYSPDCVHVTEQEENDEYCKNSGITVVKVVYLKDMPFDKWDDSAHQHIHATGRYVTLSNGESFVEYEDEVYPEDSKCIYISEEEEDNFVDSTNLKPIIF